MKTKIILTFLICISCNIYISFAQKYTGWNMRFEIKDTSSNLIENPKVTLFENSKIVFNSTKNKILLKLQHNKVYSLEVTKDGYEKKVFIIDTEVPEEFLKDTLSGQFLVTLSISNFSDNKPKVKYYFSKRWNDILYVILDNEYYQGTLHLKDTMFMMYFYRLEMRDRIIDSLNNDNICLKQQNLKISKVQYFEFFAIIFLLILIVIILIKKYKINRNK